MISEAEKNTELLLKERTCELGCVCAFGQLVEVAEHFDRLLADAAALLPSAWLHSECVASRIRWKDLQYVSRSVKDGYVGLRTELLFFGASIGDIQIIYHGDCQHYYADAQVLSEKGRLLDTLAKRLGHVGERFHAHHTIATQQRQLVQADKLVAMGTLAAGVAHEINNPTCFIMLNTPMLEEMWAPVEDLLRDCCRERHIKTIGKFDAHVLLKSFPTLLAGIHKGARRIKHIVSEMKEFVRPDDQSMGNRVDINEVVMAAEALLQNKIKNTTSGYVSLCGENIPPVKGNFQRLEQVLINLIMNACEALTEESQRVTVKTFVDEEGFVCLEVSDEGTGISAQDYSRIFDPFFTTKRTIGGTGLGLAISNTIVAEHEGTLDYRSEQGRGTSVIMRLPAMRETGGGPHGA